MSIFSFSCQHRREEEIKKKFDNVQLIGALQKSLLLFTFLCDADRVNKSCNSSQLCDFWILIRTKILYYVYGVRFFL